MTVVAVFEVIPLDNPTVEELANYEIYRANVSGLIARFGGTYIVRGGKGEGLEGNAPWPRWHVIQFDNAEQVRSFWNSEEYQNLKRLRDGVVSVRAVLVSTD